VTNAAALTFEFSGWTFFVFISGSVVMTRLHHSILLTCEHQHDTTVSDSLSDMHLPLGSVNQCPHTSHSIPPSSSRHYLSHGDCLQVKKEDYQNCCAMLRMPNDINMCAVLKFACHY